MKTYKIFTLFFVFAMLLAACNMPNVPGLTRNNEESKLALLPPGPTLQSTTTPLGLLDPTATPESASLDEQTGTIDWTTVPAPPEKVSSLPQILSDQIFYEQPPVNCAEKNDTQMTCSTREGQATHGPVTLDPNEARVSTGDEVYYFESGAPLALPFPSETDHTLWVLLNVSDKPLELEMDCAYGCFRGNFKANWTTELLAHLRDLTIWQFLIGPNPIPTAAPAGPTPVVNCANTDACPESNIIVGVWDGSNWFWQNGTYVDFSLTGNNWLPQ